MMPLEWTFAMASMTGMRMRFASSKEMRPPAFSIYDWKLTPSTNSIAK